MNPKKRSLSGIRENNFETDWFFKVLNFNFLIKIQNILWIEENKLIIIGITEDLQNFWNSKPNLIFHSILKGIEIGL